MCCLCVCAHRRTTTSRARPRVSRTFVFTRKRESERECASKGNASFTGRPRRELQVRPQSTEVKSLPLLRGFCGDARLEAKRCPRGARKEARPGGTRKRHRGHTTTERRGGEPHTHTHTFTSSHEDDDDEKGLGVSFGKNRSRRREVVKPTRWRSGHSGHGGPRARALDVRALVGVFRCRCSSCVSPTHRGLKEGWFVAHSAVQQPCRSRRVGRK